MTALRSALLLASTTLTLTAAPALAQEQAHEELHDDTIVVSGHPPIDFGLLASSTNIEGDTLILQTRTQLGDILDGLPGVSATSFAPGASRPVLRGFDGDRIRVLTDGIGGIDASNVSADHAVVFDSLTVDHIDVLHGPAVLLFGGQAIGGAVNALDKRIPRRVPESLGLTALGGYGSAAGERSAAAAIEVRLADRLAFHADGSWRESDNLRIGGFVASPALRADLLADAAGHRADGEAGGAEELEELANLSGRLPNSAARTWTLGAGIAFIDAGGNLGLSVQRTDSRYGVPLRPGAGHGHEGEEESGADEEHHADAVTIGLVQTRVDLRGAVNLSGLFDSLQIRSAFGDYSHTEFEGAETGTVFAGRGVEARLDLVQRDNGGWRGRSGVQYMARKLTVRGPEAFTPDNEVTRFGVFTLQSLKLGAVELEAAGRYERATVTSQPIGFHRAFDLWSGAAGLSWSFAEGWKLGANTVRGARAPAPEELLSDGMHVATQSYEVGNPDFVIERSKGYEAYLRYSGEAVKLSITGYLTDFDRFITALPTGAEIEGLPEFAYAQVPARFQGFEASAAWTALDNGSDKLTLDAGADYTDARLKGIGPVPRIPALRLKSGAEWEGGSFRLRAEIEWNDAQNRVAAFETPVAGFTLVNLSADWHPLGEDGPLTLLLSADNILNVDGRRAASYTRDFVPIAGRDLRMTAKLTF